uniref:Large ribosomal subunit protein uL29c n=1 Tax=Dictyopteris divaricata TaxID=156996 RepID=A0A2I4Q2I4_9PHAE|nr:50S ribosomal protein L29 [Dictyopteris divaricata]YP_010205339.1 50S ribosomal protein L29 [Grateloupia livida]AQZ25050.1 50S ribosomal protein L29 [Dictyopteris divaricata]UAV85908.1 50S ribosomal protein L29 [Grateloupia livida]
MVFPKIEDVKDLNLQELENEILSLKKQLFKLRFCQATKETFKPHEFKHKKHRLAQLFLLKKELEKKENNLVYI